MVDTGLLLRRVATIRHSVARLRGKHALTEAQFLEDADAQDVVLRNLQVGIQAALDAASHIITDSGWQLPGSSVGTFEVLARHRVLDGELAGRLRKAVTLRNLLVHAYDTIRPETVYAIYHTDLNDLELFCEAVARLV